MIKHNESHFPLYKTQLTFNSLIHHKDTLFFTHETILHLWGIRGHMLELILTLKTAKHDYSAICKQLVSG